jgi:hypothetical protein
MYKRVVVAMGASCVLMAFANAPAQQRDARERLGDYPLGWDRSQLIASSSGSSLDDGTSPLRCATRPVSEAEKDLVDLLVGSELPQRDLTTLAGKTIIPVIFHIVRKKNVAFDVTDQQVGDQMAVLSAAFSSKGFRFELKETIRHDDNRFASKCLDLGVERGFKRKHAVDPATTLNVYTCRPTASVLGYAWFPNDWTEADPMHGVVIHYASMPGGTFARFNEGDTLTHEVGHYLGLYHTFQGGCSGLGDRVDDTPAEGAPTEGCPDRKDSCPNVPRRDPTTNFMDYTDDRCMLRFTGGQKDRMLKQVSVFRPSLLLR